MKIKSIAKVEKLTFDAYRNAREYEPLPLVSHGVYVSTYTVEEAHLISIRAVVDGPLELGGHPDLGLKHTHTRRAAPRGPSAC